MYNGEGGTEEGWRQQVLVGPGRGAPGTPGSSSTPAARKDRRASCTSRSPYPVPTGVELGRWHQSARTLGWAVNQIRAVPVVQKEVDTPPCTTLAISEGKRLRLHLASSENTDEQACHLLCWDLLDICKRVTCCPLTSRPRGTHSCTFVASCLLQLCTGGLLVAKQVNMRR